LSHRSAVWCATVPFRGAPGLRFVVGHCSVGECATSWRVGGVEVFIIACHWGTR